MIDSFIQSDLNMVLYVSSRPKVMYVLTSVGPSYSISRGKNNLLSMICCKGLMILCLTSHLLINIDLTILSLTTMRIMYVRP
jgi:hypothetical protein